MAIEPSLQLEVYSWENHLEFSIAMFDYQRVYIDDLVRIFFRYATVLLSDLVVAKVDMVKLS